MYTFKAGDMIRMKQYCSGCKEGNTYQLHQGSVDRSAMEALFAWDEEMKKDMSNGGGCSCQDKWELVPPTVQSKKPSSVNFLLEFAANGRTVFEFETLPELRARLKELAKDSAVNKDSFRVYEIKKAYKVKLGYSITLTKQK